MELQITDPIPKPDQTNPLIVAREGAVARLRFNRPTVFNAIDVDMAQAFLAAVRDVAADPSVRVVVLSGEGRAFMAGGDLAALRADPVRAADALITPMHEALFQLTRLPCPVLAILHGAVAGAGLSLALACDLAIAAEGTRFSLAYVNVGTSCDVGASWSLPRVVGQRKALELALLGDTVDAAEALRLGLVNRVVPAAELAQEGERLAQRLASGPPTAHAELKGLMRDSWQRSMSEQLHAEHMAFRRCAATGDFVEAIDAFFAKRPARFQGA
jgi:2-(1,2-epoxy-1,2-dihydrophenyl)acetyl-CoA isomerase